MDAEYHRRCFHSNQDPIPPTMAFQISRRDLRLLDRLLGGEDIRGWGCEDIRGLGGTLGGTLSGGG